MKWITRERPKIDRIACPWLIARFIDPEPELFYGPRGEVLQMVEETGAAAPKLVLGINGNAMIDIQVEPPNNATNHNQQRIIP